MMFKKKTDEKATILEKQDIDIIIRGMNLFFLSLSRHIVGVLINEDVDKKVIE